MMAEIRANAQAREARRAAAQPMQPDYPATAVLSKERQETLIEAHKAFFDEDADRLIRQGSRHAIHDVHNDEIDEEEWNLPQQANEPAAVANDPRDRKEPAAVPLPAVDGPFVSANGPRSREEAERLAAADPNRNLFRNGLPNTNSAEGDNEDDW